MSPHGLDALTFDATFTNGTALAADQISEPADLASLIAPVLWPEVDTAMGDGEPPPPTTGQGRLAQMWPSRDA